MNCSDAFVAGSAKKLLEMGLNPLITVRVSDSLLLAAELVLVVKQLHGVHNSFIRDEWVGIVLQKWSLNLGGLHRRPF